MKAMPAFFRRTCGRRMWRTALVALAVLPTALHANPVVDAELLVAVTANMRPLAWRDERGELVGLNVELAQAVCEKAKLRCRVVDLPVQEVLAGVMRGEIDMAVANLAATPQRAARMLFSRAYLSGPSMWIGRGTTEQSRMLRVATPQDIRWDYVLAHQAQRRWTPVPVPSGNAVFDVLRQGKADAALVNFVVGHNFLAETRLQAAGFSLHAVKAAEISSPGGSIGVSTARGAALLQKVDTALETFNLNGKLDALLARHLSFHIH